MCEEAIHDQPMHVCLYDATCGAWRPACADCLGRSALSACLSLCLRPRQIPSHRSTYAACALVRIPGRGLAQLLAGIVGYLSGKLRDYRGHFGCDTDEMRLCVLLWRAGVGALGASNDAGVDGAAAAREVDRQARSLIEASVARHVRRLRLTIANDLRGMVHNDSKGADATGAEQGAHARAETGTDTGEESGTEGELSSDTLEESLCQLFAAVAEEVEVEAQFVACFDGCVLADGRASPMPEAAAAAVDRSSPAPPAQAFALDCFQRALAKELATAMRTYQTISSGGMAVLQGLSHLYKALAQAGCPSPLPALTALCEQMVEGWCMRTSEVLDETLQRALDGDSWEAVSPTAQRTSSVVDVLTQLDRLTQVYTTFCALLPQPLPPRVHDHVLHLLEKQVSTYVAELVAWHPALPPSALQRERRCSQVGPGGGGGGARVAGGAAGGGEPGGGRTARSQESQESQESQASLWTIEQLCLQLSNCEWAGEQLLVLAARLRSDVAGLGRLPGGAVRACEKACRDLLDEITTRTVYHHLEPLLLGRLYTPLPESGRVELVLAKLEPLLALMRRAVAPRWAQRLLEAVLSTFAVAVAAVVELPTRRFAAHHQSLLSADVDAIGHFFLSATGGVVQETVVRGALAFLYTLGAQACCKQP